MLTKKEKLAILDYNEDICDLVISARINVQRIPGDRYLAVKRSRREGCLIAIRELVDLLGLPKDFLPNRDSIIV